MKTVRNIVILSAIVAAAVIIVDAVATRDSQPIYIPGEGVVTDASSGRTAAWAYFYRYAKANLLFGRGLGSGPVVGAGYQHFLAQHNEYLRLLLEGGYVGGILVLLSIIGVIALAISRAPRSVRVLLITFALGVAAYSATDNTLSSPQFSAPMVLGFAIGAAPSASRRRLGPPRPGGEAGTSSSGHHPAYQTTLRRPVVLVRTGTPTREL